MKILYRTTSPDRRLSLVIRRVEGSAAGGSGASTRSWLGTLAFHYAPEVAISSEDGPAEIGLVLPEPGGGLEASGISWSPEEAMDHLMDVLAEQVMLSMDTFLEAEISNHARLEASLGLQEALRLVVPRASSLLHMKALRAGRTLDIRVAQTE